MSQEPLPPTVSGVSPSTPAAATDPSASAAARVDDAAGAQADGPSGEPAPERPAWLIDLLRAALVLGVLALLILFGWWLAGASKLMGDPRQCWENREVDGRLYKMNPCTGQWRLIGDTEPRAGDR